MHTGLSAYPSGMTESLFCAHWAYNCTFSQLHRSAFFLQCFGCASPWPLGIRKTMNIWDCWFILNGTHVHNCTSLWWFWAQAFAMPLTFCLYAVSCRRNIFHRMCACSQQNEQLGFHLKIKLLKGQEDKEVSGSEQFSFKWPHNPRSSGQIILVPVSKQSSFKWSRNPYSNDHTILIQVIT